MNSKEKLIPTVTTQMEIENKDLVLIPQCEQCQQKFSDDLGISLGYTKYLWAKLLRDLMGNRYTHVFD